jgi:hypothetical protein
MTKATKTKKCAMCNRVTEFATMQQIRTVGVGFEYLCDRCYEAWFAARYPSTERSKKFYANHVGRLI